jgi:hypothetical protein
MYLFIFINLLYDHFKIKKSYLNMYQPVYMSLTHDTIV